MPAMQTDTEQRRIVFFDTETTELREDREIWEIGLIVRDPGQPDREQQVIVTDCDFTWANPFSLRLGGAYQRHPRFNGGERKDGVAYLDQRQAAAELERVTRDAVIVGAVPDFDTNGGKILLRRHGLPWSGHYHIHDVETLIVGYLAGQRAAGIEVVDLGPPPWKSEDLSRAVGVEPPAPHERHTALGDARWVRDQWDTVTKALLAA